MCVGVYAMCVCVCDTDPNECSARDTPVLRSTAGMTCIDAQGDHIGIMCVCVAREELLVAQSACMESLVG